MTYRTFMHNFHDGNLVSFTLGPRRELTLEIALDPVWNKESPPIVYVRFGGIENYDEVASFVRALPPPQQPAGYIAEVIGLLFVGDGPNSVILNLDRHGHIQVHSRHVTES